MESTRTLRPEFTAVAEAFDRIVAADPVGGSALAAFVDGECVLNLWGGDARPGTPWDADTLTTIFSCTKGLTAITTAMLVERGLLDPAAPVAQYWPAFTSVSSSLTVRELLEHRSGLSAVRHDMRIEEVIDHSTLVATLLAQGPLWEPGTGYAYHSLTFGTVVDELIRQATGRTLSDWFQELIARPLDVDVWIGLPEAHEHRMTELAAAGSFTLPVDPALHPHEMEQRAGSFGTAFPIPRSFEPGVGFNSRAVHAASLGGVNGAAGAFALAKIWSSVIVPTDGVRLLSDAMVRMMAETRVTGAPVWGGAGPFWDRGFGVMLETPALRAALGPGSFGHDGLGGQIGWASPALGASIGFVSNALHPGATQLDRWGELGAEFVAALDRARS